MFLQKALSTFPRLLLFTIALFLSGCASTYKVDPDLVSKFKPELTPTKEETFVYVIRGSNFKGGMRGAWVAANKEVVADLSNGSHTLIKLKAGINSLHMVQGLAGFGYVKLDNRAGETVYLAIDYSTGEMKEVGFDLGASMIMQTQKAKKIKQVRKNDAYDNLLANPSVLGFPVMKSSDTVIRPDQESAVINFYRMEKLAGKVPFDIWSKDGYVGSTTTGTYFQVRVKPGKHTFLSLSEHYSVLEADVKAGEEYVVEFDVDMGWNQAHVQLLPINAKKSAKEIAKWQKKAQLKTVDMDVVNQPEFQHRVNEAKEYLLRQYNEVEASKKKSRKLNTEHAISK